MTARGNFAGIFGSFLVTIGVRASSFSVLVSVKLVEVKKRVESVKARIRAHVESVVGACKLSKA
jgi:uncharacterized membrane protein